MKNKQKIIYVIFSLLIVLIITLFHPNDVSKKMDPEIYKKLKIINQKNIYFGHKSVGVNIVAGLSKINSLYGQSVLIIKDLKDVSKIDNNYFIHSNIGQNGDPKGKFKEFMNIVNNLKNNKLDIAMMKLCFVDITKETKIDDVFHSYVDMIDSIQKKYPDLTIIHFTVPLKSNPSLLNKIKDIIKGRNNYDQQDNMARIKYNELLFSKYSKNDIFDLAGAESTYPDGKRESILVSEKTCYFLITDYTNDGGHLNELGQQVIAEKFIVKLANRIINIKSNYNSLTNNSTLLSK